MDKYYVYYEDLWLKSFDCEKEALQFIQIRMQESRLFNVLSSFQIIKVKS